MTQTPMHRKSPTSPNDAGVFGAGWTLPVKAGRRLMVLIRQLQRADTRLCRTPEVAI